MYIKVINVSSVRIATVHVPGERDVCCVLRGNLEVPHETIGSTCVADELKHYAIEVCTT